MPLVLLLRLTVYAGAAGVRVESAGGAVSPEVSRAMSSRTKLVWRLESSVPVKATVTVWPAKADTSNDFWAYPEALLRFE